MYHLPGFIKMAAQPDSKYRPTFDSRIYHHYYRGKLSYYKKVLLHKEKHRN